MTTPDTTGMPAAPITADAGLGAVARQTTMNLQALQQLTSDFKNALSASGTDRESLHRQADQIAAALDAITARQARSARAAAVPAVTTVAGTATTDVSLTWTIPWPDASYAVAAWIEAPAALLGKTSVAVKSKTATGCVITVTTSAAIAAGTASVRAIAVTA